MPHAELKYSSDLTINATAILARIEYVIATHDGEAGECKGRAYPTDLFHHTHLMVDISMLPKPHRDAGFFNDLAKDLGRAVTSMLTQPCYFSLEITTTGGAYVTNQFNP